MISVVKVKHDEVAAGIPARLFKSDQPGLADGAQSRDFIWVGDVVDVHDLADGDARRSAACSTSAPAPPAPTWISRDAVCDAAGKPRAIQFIDMPDSLRGQYQSFTQAPMDRLRAAGYARPFTPLEEGIRRYVQDHLSGPDLYV